MGLSKQYSPPEGPRLLVGVISRFSPAVNTANPIAGSIDCAILAVVLPYVKATLRIHPGKISRGALGSAGGGLLRWSIGLMAARLLGTALPYGTFFINITGSIFLGWFLTVLAERTIVANQSWIHVDDLRLMVAVGFTGAHTTFSTFEWESNNLLRDGESFWGTMYIVASVVLGLLGVRVGVALARFM